MPPPSDILLGPLTNRISDDAVWWREGNFPSSQVGADELERLLEYLLVQGRFDQFLPRLRCIARQRDATLAEAWSSLFLFRSGFRILEYDPSGANGTTGDLTIQWQSSPPIFVEIKNPSWRGEPPPKSEAEQRKEFMRRKNEPQHITDEFRWMNPIGQVLSVVVKNALRKLHDDRPSLVVVSDDLPVSVVDDPNLEATVRSPMQFSAFRGLGGILFLKPQLLTGASEFHYGVAFVENEWALTPCRLPQEIVIGLTRSAHEYRKKSVGTSTTPGTGLIHD